MTGLRTKELHDWTEEEQKIWASNLETNELIKLTNYCIQAKSNCKICKATSCKLKTTEKQD